MVITCGHPKAFQHAKGMCKTCYHKIYNCSSIHKAASRKSKLKNKYGITVEEYDYRYKQQRGKCKICRVTYTALSVDHDHATGKVRGLLCQLCNIGIGALRDDPKRLKRAAAYLAQKVG